MTTLSPLHSLPSFTRAHEAFAVPIEGPTCIPADLRSLVRAVATWDTHTRRVWGDYHRHSVYRRAVGLGTAIGDAIRLQRAIRTHRIDAHTCHIRFVRMRVR
jgi:hypothetical protein